MKENKKENSINDLNEVRDFLLNLILKAGEILKEKFISRDYSLKQKEGVDFTTQADEEVDSFLVKNIKQKYPDTLFLTEETAPDDYSDFKNYDNLWVIDPLDGTINFSRQNPNFAISVALVDKGIPKIGVVHIPLTGDCYWAQIDKDEAYLNENPIKVSLTSEMREIVLACDWAWDLNKRKNVVKWLGKIIVHIRQAKFMGSAVADLASLARGSIDAYMHSGLKPWDVSASSLLIQKAGGRISIPTGKEWNIFEPDILATNRILHKKILDIITSH